MTARREPVRAVSGKRRYSSTSAWSTRSTTTCGSRVGAAAAAVMVARTGWRSGVVAAFGDTRSAV